MEAFYHLYLWKAKMIFPYFLLPCCCRVANWLQERQKTLNWRWTLIFSCVMMCSLSMWVQPNTCVYVCCRLSEGQAGFHPIELKHIDTIVEVGQVGLRDQGKLWLHSDPRSQKDPQVKSRVCIFMLDLRNTGGLLNWKTEYSPYYGVEVALDSNCISSCMPSSPNTTKLYSEVTPTILYVLKVPCYSWVKLPVTHVYV